MEHSSTADKNRIFTAFMCRDKPNKLTSLHEIAQNALLTPNEVEPTIFSFPGVIVQGDMPSSLVGN